MKTSSIVSAAWVFQNLDNKKLILLDCTLNNQLAKMPLDIQNIRIRGARFFDIKNNFSNTEDPFPSAYPSSTKFESEARKLGINDDSIIVVYDANGIYSSPRAWWLFKSFGHENVHVLNGGLPEWIKSGYPTENKLKQEFTQGNFKTKDRNSIVRKYSDILNNLVSKKELVVDVRSHERFMGFAPEPREGLRSGQIPSSMNLPYTKVLKDGKFLKETELVKIFSDLSKENKTIVFSFGSGITACVVYLASEAILNSHKAVYDGSWTEWGEKYID
jgi:thiosulfate/3-mercaptopyruvate sulfurtransferase